MASMAGKMVTADGFRSPEDVNYDLVSERNAAKNVVEAKSKEVKLFTRKVARLSKKAKQLTDDGLLLEYARRKKAKQTKLKTTA